MRPDKKNFEERQLPGYNMNISRAGHNEGIIQVPFKQVEKSLKTAFSKNPRKAKLWK